MFTGYGVKIMGKYTVLLADDEEEVIQIIMKKSTGTRLDFR